MEQFLLTLTRQEILSLQYAVDQFVFNSYYRENMPANVTVLKGILATVNSVLDSPWENDVHD